MKLYQDDFQAIADYVREISGIRITPDKKYLVSQRLTPLLKHLGVESFSLFSTFVKNNDSPSLRRGVVDAITTNEVSFVRDHTVFNPIKMYVIPSLADTLLRRRAGIIDDPDPKIRILLEGSGDGEEAHILAMLIHEYTYANDYQGLSLKEFSIIGRESDHKKRALALSGESDFEMLQGLPSVYRDRYLKESEGRFVVHDDVRRIVSFIPSEQQPEEHFDFVICMESMDFYPPETRKQMAEDLVNRLKTGGWLLLLSTCENLTESETLEPLSINSHNFYRKI